MDDDGMLDTYDTIVFRHTTPTRTRHLYLTFDL